MQTSGGARKTSAFFVHEIVFRCRLMGSLRTPVTHQSGARAQLERWVRSATTPQRLVWRSQIALFALDGVSTAEIATRLGVSHPTVRLWLRRFASGGPPALLRDAPGRGRRPSIDYDTLMSRLRDANLIGTDGQPTSLRDAAQLLGVSTSTVWRALRKRPSAR
jgi:transposase